MQRVQVPTSSLRRKKYSIPGLSCVLIKITSFKTPFELNNDQWRWADFMPEAGRLMACLTWCSPYHPLVLLGSPGVHSSCPAGGGYTAATEIQCKPLMCQMLLFVADKTEEIST